MEILTAAQIKKVDEIAVQSGLNEADLIENAGFAAACVIADYFEKRPVCVLCGAGNNGADGLVCARILQNFGWRVQVLLFGDKSKMRPAAASKLAAFTGDIFAFSFESAQKAAAKGSLFVDALFGTGFSRDLPDEIAETFRFLNEINAVCAALDMPSGARADTGALSPIALKCAATITFCRCKPAAFLYPAKAFFGELFLRGAGLPDSAVSQAKPYLETIDENTKLPAPPSFADHKYTRGATLIVGGRMSGAGRLAALGAQKAGAGMVKIAAPSASLPLYARHPAFVTQACDDEKSLAAAIADKKVKSVALGMGLGDDARAAFAVKAAASCGKPVVFDADALRFLKGADLKGQAVLTPHAAEFSALFGDIDEEGKINRARKAAERAGAVVVLKGADTVVADPSGKAAINTNAPFTLATAGSGDVLAGIAAAYLANGLPPYEAAKAAVFTHSQDGFVSGVLHGD